MTKNTLTDFYTKADSEVMLNRCKTYIEHMLTSFVEYTGPDTERGNPTLVAAAIDSPHSEPKGLVVRAIAEKDLTDEDREALVRAVEGYQKAFDESGLRSTSDFKNYLLSLVRDRLINASSNISDETGVCVAVSLHVNAFFELWKREGILPEGVDTGEKAFIVSLTPVATGTAVVRLWSQGGSTAPYADFSKSCQELSPIIKEYFLDHEACNVFGVFRKSEKGVLTAYVVSAPLDQSPMTESEKSISEMMGKLTETHQATMFRKSMVGIMGKRLSDLKDGEILFEELPEAVRALSVASQHLRQKLTETCDLVLADGTADGSSEFTALYAGRMDKLARLRPEGTVLQ